MMSKQVFGVEFNEQQQLLACLRYSKHFNDQTKWEMIYQNHLAVSD